MQQQQDKSQQNRVITVTSQRLKSPTTPRLFQPFFQTYMKETAKPGATGPLWGESPVTGGFPSQRASNAGRVSI